MKKIILIAISLFSLLSYSQNIYVKENIIYINDKEISVEENSIEEYATYNDKVLFITSGPNEDRLYVIDNDCYYTYSMPCNEWIYEIFVDTNNNIYYWCERYQKAYNTKNGKRKRKWNFKTNISFKKFP